MDIPLFVPLPTFYCVAASKLEFHTPVSLCVAQRGHLVQSATLEKPEWAPTTHTITHSSSHLLINKIQWVREFCRRQRLGEVSAHVGVVQEKLVKACGREEEALLQLFSFCVCTRVSPVRCSLCDGLRREASDGFPHGREQGIVHPPWMRELSSPLVCGNARRPKRRRRDPGACDSSFGAGSSKDHLFNHTFDRPRVLSAGVGKGGGCRQTRLDAGVEDVVSKSTEEDDDARTEEEVDDISAAHSKSEPNDDDDVPQLDFDVFPVDPADDPASDTISQAQGAQDRLRVTCKSDLAEAVLGIKLEADGPAGDVPDWQADLEDTDSVHPTILESKPKTLRYLPRHGRSLLRRRYQG